MFLDDRIVAVAYVENEGGWIVVANELAGRPYDAAFDALLEYRGYVDPDEVKVWKVVKALYHLEYDMLDAITSE